MKVIRYISRKELKTLLETGRVDAKYKHPTGLRCYYFPVVKSIPGTIKYNIQFSSGIVASDDDDDDDYWYLCICLNKDKRKLNKTNAYYADPHGDFWDTIVVAEVYDNKYTLDEVQSIYKVKWYGRTKRLNKKKMKDIIG